MNFEFLITDSGFAGEDLCLICSGDSIFLLEFSQKLRAQEEMNFNLKTYTDENYGGRLSFIFCTDINDEFFRRDGRDAIISMSSQTTANAADNVRSICNTNGRAYNYIDLMDFNNEEFSFVVMNYFRPDYPGSRQRNTT